MAYCPLAQAGRLRDDLFNSRAVQDVAHAHQATPAQVLLAWAIRQPGVMAIPKASSVDHVKENAAALALQLSDEAIALLDQAFPAPGRKTPLDVV